MESIFQHIAIKLDEQWTVTNDGTGMNLECQLITQI